MEKLPPIEKVYEAWTALADGRVKMNADSATVTSSNGEKTYTVQFAGDTYASNDNGTYWRGYAGYPVIAVLMLQGRLPYDREMARLWSGVDWNAVNKKHRNDYSKAVAEIESDRGIDSATAATAARRVMDVLAELPLTIKRKL